jgi:hypothetical protein
MVLRPIASVLLAALVVLPAVALVQYWRDRLYRWRLALVTSVWLISLSNVVLELTGTGLLPEFVLWPALAVVSALAGMAGIALTVWFWRQHDRASSGPVGA